MSVYIYRYRVTESTVPSVAIGSVLTYRNRSKEMDWTFIDPSTSAMTHIHGVRVGDRLCPECYDKRRLATRYGHPESHLKAPVYLLDTQVSSS